MVVAAATPGHVSADGTPAVRGRIGPNSVIQLAAALCAAGGETAAQNLFGRLGFSDLLGQPPTDMIDEHIPAALFDALWRHHGPQPARSIAADAGRRTADYVLQNRIPRVAQAVLRTLPARLAAPVLLKAIEKNAWTFAGSGTCRTRSGRICRIEVEDNPLVMPGCAWHSAVFERLFRELVSARTEVRCVEDGCKGDRVCRFTLELA